MERTADYIIRKLTEAGAGHLFLVSGRGILYLTDAAARAQSLRKVCTYHEQGASYAAMAYAAASEGIGACLVSTGCASANAVTAALCAYQDNLPVVFISGNNPLRENRRHTGAPIRTYGSQETDIIPVVQSVTKYAVMLERAEDTVREVEKALYLAQTGRKGPVWIDVPLDVQNMRIEESELAHFIPPEEPPVSFDAAETARALDAAERPVLLIGGGARGAADAVRALAEQYQLPVIFSPAAADIYGAQYPLSVGAAGSLGGSRAGSFALQNSDFVLAVGTKLCSQLTGLKEQFARAARITVVDIDPDEHRKDGVRIDRLITADAADFLHALCGCGLRPHPEWAARCMHWKEVFAVENEDFVQHLRAENRLDLYSLACDLQAYLPEDATVITDAGFEALTVPAAIRYRTGQRCLFPAAQGAMGYAIPAILGAYFAGRRSLLCIVGDGSVMMNLQELQMISALHIPVRILIIRNNMYAVIRKRQTDLFRRRTLGNDPSDGVPAPDFRALAQGFGIPYRAAESRGEFLAMLPALFPAEDPEIIEVACDPEQKYFHESYALNEDRRLVHRPIEDLSPFLPRELIAREMLIPPCE